MSTLLHVIMVILIVIAVLFVLSFIVYFFNLDMKLTSKLEPIIQMHYDKIDRERKL